MKILVTDIEGFVGKQILNMFNENVSQGISSERSHKCRQRMCPAHNFHILSNDQHLCGVDAIIDSAAYGVDKADKTLALARRAAKNGVKRFVFISSIGVNGASTLSEPFSVDSVVRPHNDYSRSKYQAEIELKKLACETGLELVIVRPTLVYGLHASGNFSLLSNLVRKLPVLPFGLASNRRDFISVQNFADLLVLCAIHPKAAGHTFLASEGETVSIRQFTNAIAEAMEKHVIQLPIPIGLLRLVGKVTGKSAMIDQLLGNLEVDSSKIKEVLDWVPPKNMKQSMKALFNPGN